MKIKLLLPALLIVFALSSCKKDLATDWVGTYNSTTNSTYNRVVVTKVNDNTIRLDLQVLFLGSYVTQATVANGHLSSASLLGIDEDGSISGNNGTWHFSGAGSRDGDKLTLNGTASQSGQQDIDYTFIGEK